MTDDAARPLVCVIDDDEDMHLLLDRMLKHGGFRMAGARDGIEGEDLLRREKPDLIILDVMMPKINGYDFCAKLQQGDEFAHIPVVFMTALEGEQDKAKAFASGAAEYLIKPIDPKHLIEVVGRHLRGKDRWAGLAQKSAGSAGHEDATEFGRFKEFLLVRSSLGRENRTLDGVRLDGVYSAAAKLGLTRERIARLIAQFARLEYLPRIHPESLQLGVLPAKFCVSHQVIAIKDETRRTAFVVSNPFQFETQELIRRNFGAGDDVIFYVTEPEKIARLLKRRSREEISKVIEHNDADIPVSDITTHLLETAVHERASDIHIEPKERETIIRFRVDGDLREIFRLRNATSLQVVSRFKALADLDVAERRRPQDGVLDAVVDGRSFIVRLATTSTPNGESLVLRLLEPWAKAQSLSELGMSDKQIEHMMGFAQRNQGLLLIAGPTGSGKTTTVYSLLQHIDCAKRSLISIEDPVEYRIMAANQQQVDEKAGMTFESLLKSAVRQDPDILYMGEIRDHFSSKMAVDFASTGHLTVSTVHTANATTAIFRLERVGVSRGAMADSVLGVIAQKLVKRLCPHCKETGPITAQEREMLSAFTADVPAQVARPVGCEKCRDTGFFGREGIYEIVKFYPEISEMIRRDAPISEIRDFAQKRGDFLIGEHAIEKVRALIFSPKDVYEQVLLEESEYRRRGDAPAAAPAAAAAEGMIGKPKPTAAAGGELIGGGTGAAVLVVEDDEETRVLLERVLGNRGYAVTVACDGVEALMKLGQRRFDLILSDIEMPNLDGLKLLELMAVKGILTPVVFLTALTGAVDELKGFELGAEDYIKKPVAKDILLLRVQRALAKRR
ncbi:MAG: ATPase, T2SS/T4P/T4SS family [Elusimicrobiota bacterium]